MNRYETYKPSGIDWIGDVPKQWEIKRLKDVANVTLGKMLQNDDSGADNLKPYLRSFNVQWDRVDLSEVKEMWLSEYEQEQYRLRKYDLVISEGGEVGRCAIWLDEIEECYIQNSVHKVTCNKRILPYFLLYQFTTAGRAGHFDKIINKVSIGHLTREKLVAVNFVLPPKSEQLTIANYLDDQTQKIDRLIANKKAQTEKLKELRQIEINNAVTKGLNPNTEMKDSGIEWLGKIPKHWEKRKIATNFQIIGSGTTPDAGNEEYYDETGKYYFVNTGDLKDCEIYDCEKKITEEAFTKFTSLKLFPVNTLLIAMYGATIGKVGILKTEATTNQACCALANSYRFNIDYMFYFFIGIREDIIRLSYGGGQPNISQDTIKQLRIPCPPKDEQLQIVEHLKKRTTALDQLIKNIGAQIEKLQELRKIKIYEAVTGKIKVNGYGQGN